MEFERSVFRIHERSLAAFANEVTFAGARGVSGGGKRLCIGVTACCSALFALCLAGLIALHSAYAYKPGCVYSLLDSAVSTWAADSANTGIPGNATAATFLRPSDVVRLGIDYTRAGCPFQIDGNTAAKDGSYVGCIIITEGAPNTNATSGPAPLLYFSTGKGSRQAVSQGQVQQRGSELAAAIDGLDPAAGPGAGYISDYLYSQTTAGLAIALQSESNIFATAGGNAATDWLDGTRVDRFRRISIIVPPTCAAAGTGYSRDVLSTYDLIVGGLMSFDSILINDLMWGNPDAVGSAAVTSDTAKSAAGLWDGSVLKDSQGNTAYFGGNLRNVYTGEDWSWGRPRADLVGLGFQGPLSPIKPLSGYDWSSFSARVDMFLRLGVIGFFCLSVVNALLVRVLFSSGVAIMYLFARLIGSCFAPAWAPSTAAARMQFIIRQLNLAYPWLGVHAHVLAQHGLDIGPLVFANVLFSVLIFLLYESGANGLSSIMFGWKSFPSALPATLWTIFGLAEAFSFVFIRTKRSIRLFPRAMWIMYLAWVWYHASTPYGFSTEAALVLALGLVVVGLLCLYFYEIPALAAEKVSELRPREMMVELGMRELAAVGSVVMPHGLALPPLWTIVHPLQSLRAEDSGVAGGAGADGAAGQGAAEPSAAATAGNLTDEQVAVAMDSSQDRGMPLLDEEDEVAGRLLPSR